MKELIDETETTEDTLIDYSSVFHKEELKEGEVQNDDLDPREKE